MPSQPIFWTWFLRLFTISLSMVCNSISPALKYIFKIVLFLRSWCRTSLVVQWIRIYLPIQGTWVQSLVWEDSTYLGAAKHVHHNYWAYVLGPASCSYWSLCATAPQQEEPPQGEARASQVESSPHSPQLEKSHAQCQRSRTATQNKINYIYTYICIYMKSSWCRQSCILNDWEVGFCKKTLASQKCW